MSHERARVPAWFAKAGYVTGLLTLLFFMSLVMASIFGRPVPADARFIVCVVIALGCALSFAFIGGSAAAHGSLPIPAVKERAVEFSLGGGIAVFVIVLIIAYRTYPEPSSLTSPVVGDSSRPQQPMTTATVNVFGCAAVGAGNNALVTADCRVIQNKLEDAGAEIAAADRQRILSTLTKAMGQCKEIGARLTTLLGDNIDAQGYFDRKLAEATSLPARDIVARLDAVADRVKEMYEATVVTAPTQDSARRIAREMSESTVQANESTVRKIDVASSVPANVVPLTRIPGDAPCGAPEKTGDNGGLWSAVRGQAQDAAIVYGPAFFQLTPSTQRYVRLTQCAQFRRTDDAAIESSCAALRELRRAGISAAEEREIGSAVSEKYHFGMNGADFWRRTLACTGAR